MQNCVPVGHARFKHVEVTLQKWQRVGSDVTEVTTCRTDRTGRCSIRAVPAYCTYVCNVCMYACIHAYVCMYVCGVCMYLFMYACMYVCMWCVYVCMCVCRAFCALTTEPTPIIQMLLGQYVHIAVLFFSTFPALWQEQSGLTLLPEQTLAFALTKI
jgi:hypothetical protein